MSWYEIESINYTQNDIYHYKNSNNYQNFLRNSNWDSTSICYYDKLISKKIFLKIYFKKILSIYFVNAPGGFDKKYSNLLYEELIDYLTQKFKRNFIFLMNNNEINDIPNKNFLKIKFSSIGTLIKTLPKDEKTLLTNYSSNWRHNYKRSTKKNLIININNSPNKEEVSKLLIRFNKIKNKNLYPNLINDLFFYLKYFKEHILHFECRYNNKLIALRTIITMNDKSWDLFALSDEIARVKYANYNLIHFIFLKLIEKKNKIF